MHKQVAVAVVLLALGIDLLMAQGRGQPQPQGRQGRDGGAGPQGREGGARAGGAGRQGRGGRGEPAVGTAVISGRVTAADTGSPVRRAQVRAQSGSTNRVAMTDASGRFEFGDLPAGQWTVTAGKTGFVSLRFGQQRPSEIVSPLELKDGERATANVVLPRGSAIVGRITDEFGDPIAGVRVQVLSHRANQTRGQRRLTAVGVSGQTDDTGAFRVYGLGPGEYYVSARADAAAVETTEGASTFAPTYYPGTASLDQAQRIPIAVGEEGSASFQLLLVRTVRVSGMVTDSTGAPVTSGSVALTGGFESDEGPFNPGSATRVRDDGTFVLGNVVPGSYTLQATSGGRGRGNAAVASEVGYMPLAVGSADVAGVSVMTTRGATVRGSVVAERGTGTASTTGMRVGAQPLRPATGQGLGSRATVAADGTFSLTGLIGPQVFRAEAIPRDWMLARIELGGVDVTDSTVEFKGTERADVRVVLTNRVPNVTGTIASGRKGATLHVVIFPSEPERWTAPSRYLRSARADAGGLFTIRALPPHERYRAVAVDALDDGEATDPAFLERMRDAATSFSLGEGEQKTLDLKVVERTR